MRIVEERMNKEITVFHACRKLFGRKWGLQRNIIHWRNSYSKIHNQIRKYSNQKSLTKVQRLAALGTKGSVGGDLNLQQEFEKTITIRFLWRENWVNGSVLNEEIAAFTDDFSTNNGTEVVSFQKCNVHESYRLEDE